MERRPTPSSCFSHPRFPHPGLMPVGHIRNRRRMTERRTRKSRPYAMLPWSHIPALKIFEYVAQWLVEPRFQLIQRTGREAVHLYSSFFVLFSICFPALGRTRPTCHAMRVGGLASHAAGGRTSPGPIRCSIPMRASFASAMWPLRYGGALGAQTYDTRCTIAASNRLTLAPDEGLPAEQAEGSKTPRER